MKAKQKACFHASPLHGRKADADVGLFTEIESRGQKDFEREPRSRVGVGSWEELGPERSWCWPRRDVQRMAEAELDIGTKRERRPNADVE